MPPEHTWKKWLERLYNLRREKTATHERPHKPVLLLALMELLDRGHIRENRVLLDRKLEETFQKLFNIVRQKDDDSFIGNPFYRLSGDEFWHIFVPGATAPVYQPGASGGAPTLGMLRKSYAQFDPELWASILSQPAPRSLYREALVGRYFPHHRAALNALSAPPDGKDQPALKEAFKKQRDGAFRRTVLEIYDYTCCACGLRVKLGDFCLAEAAHLIPFEVSADDRPQNGLALCPNHHVAMDRKLIAPVPSDDHRPGVWKSSSRLFAQIPGHRDLVSLAGQRVLPPGEHQFTPALESLRWRAEQLDRAG